MDDWADKCKNCGDWIEFGRTFNNRYEWTHKRTSDSRCYPVVSYAEPASTRSRPEEEK